MKRIILVVVALIAFTALGLHSLTKRDNKIELQKVELQSKQAEIKQLQIDYQVLDKKQSEVQQKSDASESEKQKLQQEKDELLKRQQELEQQLSAKREQQRIASEKVQQTASLTAIAQARPVSTGSCADWMAQAGITDYANANELIRRESGCNPNAINRSSGACGLAQELPCGKSGCGLGNGACQMKWMNSYVISRYGSWANAVAHHNANNWY